VGLHCEAFIQVNLKIVRYYLEDFSEVLKFIVNGLFSIEFIIFFEAELPLDYTIVTCSFSI